MLSRLASGFAIGAECSGSLSYLLESAPARRRGLITSMAPAMSGVGTALAVGITALLAGLLTGDQLDSWGWRIPVALGAVMAAVLLLLRRGLGETPEFRRLREQGETVANPIREAFEIARGGLLFGFVISAAGSVAYYLNISYVPTYLDSVADVSHAKALAWGTVAGFAVIGFSLLAGLASDRFGRKHALAALGLALVLTTIPLFGLLGDQQEGVVFAA